MRVEVVSGLFIGDWDQDWEELYDVGITVVVRITRQGREPKKYWRGTLLKWHFNDVEVLPDLHQLGIVVRFVRDQMTTGKSVLVQCAGGFNRSALVAGLVMVKAGKTGPEALRTIRRVRGVRALRNSVFARAVRGR